jgi:uncharacterized protein YndB with AHSA1/START domain
VATVRRTREVAAAAEEVWDMVSDPHHLPRWWPGVQRVEDASREAWTAVLRGDRGASVRADFSRVGEEPERRLVWRQELAGSPFERFMRAARTELSLEPLPGRDATEVELRSVQRLRGLARLGGPMVRRATARRLEEALDGLERIVGGAP